MRTEVVQEVLIERIAGRAAEFAPAPSEEASPLLGSDAERAGYAVRRVEAELFDPARRPAGWLADRLGDRRAEGEAWDAAAAALCRELAAAEPLEKPRPDDECAVTWRIPGPGGHVRHYVAAAMGCDKRKFVYGFLVRCCEEVR